MSNCGSNKAKNNNVATHAARNDAHSSTPRSSLKCGQSERFSASGSMVVAILGEAQDVRGQQLDLGVAEQVAVRWHLVVATVGDGRAHGFEIAAVQPHAIGEVGCAEHLVALGIDAVT